MNKLKNFLNNQFAWYTFMALASIIISGCYLYEKREILGICWAIIAGCDIAIAWLHKEDN